MPAPIENREELVSVRAKINALIAENELFDSRAELVAWVAAGNVPVNGREYRAGGLSYIGSTGATSIADLPGLVPNGVASPFHYGAVGDGTTDDRSAFAAMDAAGGAAYIPAPPVRYNFSSPLHLSLVAVTIDPSVTWDNLTDGGQLTFFRGRATASIADGSNIHRLQDRVFAGYAASHYAGSNHVGADVGNSWLTDSTVGPAYLAQNAGVLWMAGDADPTDANDAKNTLYGFVAAIKTSELGGNGGIGFGAAIVHDTPGVAAWAGISEVQRESGAGSVYGWEMAVKNKGNNAVASPNSLETGGPSGAYGLWLQGGGDPAFGGAPTAPSTAAIAILGGGSTWNGGIVFARDAITGGRAVDLSSETASGSPHGINWFNAAGNTVFTVRSSATTDTSGWTLDKQNNALRVTRDGTSLFSVAGSGNFVNGYQFFCGITGVSPQLTPIGPDANLDAHITPKGTGRLRFGTFTAGSDVPVIGHIEIKDAGGTIRKLAVIA